MVLYYFLKILKRLSDDEQYFISPFELLLLKKVESIFNLLKFFQPYIVRIFK